MAYVISICGAGGKTTLCYDLANEYLKQNLKVAVTTTTHMWCTDDFIDIKGISNLKNIENKIYSIGKIDKKNKKVLGLGFKEIDSIYNLFDIIIIEADGSRNMPFKIPDIEKEPVIYDKTNEILVVYGLSSIGRKIGVVCHRYYEKQKEIDKLNEKIKNKQYKNISETINENTIVKKELLELFYDEFYKKPLEEKYKNIKINLCLIDMTKKKNFLRYNKLSFVLLASGESKRFGKENKLLKEIKNMPMYRLMIEKILEVKTRLELTLAEYMHKVQINIDVVSIYDEIMDEVEHRDEIEYIYNDNAKKGMSSSIILSTKKNIESDAIVFFNSDMPLINPIEISNMIFYTMCSNKGLGAMFYDIPKNPAFIGQKYFKNLVSLNGDIGAKEMLNEDIDDLYKYHIDREQLSDIDTIEDYEKILLNFVENVI